MKTQIPDPPNIEEGSKIKPLEDEESKME